MSSSIITQESIDYLKDRRKKAKEATQYNTGYHCAIEALSAAIAQLEQLKVLTEGFTISISAKSEK